MMLKAIAARVLIAVAAKIRQDQKRRLVLILRIALDRTPHIGAEAVGPANGVHIQ